MAFDSLTDRTDAQALIPEEVSRIMLGKAVEQSTVLQLFRHIPVRSAQVRFPILSALPYAYWVSGDTGLKQTTDAAWTNKYLNVEEIAAILPIPDNVIADTQENIWDSIMPHLTEAFSRVLDEAVFFGVNAPSSFPDDILTSVIAASNTVTEGSHAATAGGFYGDLDEMYGLVEADGFEVTGFAAATSAKSKLRAARNADGDRLDGNRVSGDLRTLDGLPISYGMKGQFPVATVGASPNDTDGVRLFGGDFSEFVVGVRQDITMKVLTEAVIQDNTGAIVYNLAQQDMTAVRLTFRVGWQVSNRINYSNTNASTRYPVGAIIVTGT